jgi:HNH endonuclease
MHVEMPKHYIEKYDRDSKKSVRVHRANAAAALGRDLLEGEVVHHKDGDKFNNQPDNLQVLPSGGHHILLEQYQRREARGVTHLFSAEDMLERYDGAPVRVPRRKYTRHPKGSGGDPLL